MWLVTGVVLLLLLSNERFRYHCKFIIFIVSCLIVATLPIPLMLHRPKDARNALLPALGCKIISQLLGMSTIVRGKENILKDQGCVVLINHQSALDLRVLAELWPIMERCTQVAKKSLFYLWPFGLACWLWGTIFIDRVNAEEAQQKLNSTEQAIKHRKARLLMFPEGTRGDGNELLPFKKGAFHVAVNTQCPVQPVVVSKYLFLNNDRKHFGRGLSIITILPAIPTEGLTKNDIPALMEKTRNAMVDAFKKTSDEAKQFNENSSYLLHSKSE